MTTYVALGTPAHHGKQGAAESPIAVIPTSVICLQRWQIDSLVAYLGSLGYLAPIADIHVLRDGGDRFYLDYTQLSREVSESVRFLKEWSCTVTPGCRVNLRHPGLIPLILGIYGVRATAWKALEYAVVEARAEEVYDLVTSVCGGIPCFRQAELSFDAGQPLPARFGRPSRSPRGGVGAACLALV